MSQDSDEHLIRYLLGDLPGPEAQRLDERSVVDDALALRVRVLEDDLVDRYARGEPFDISLERFDRLHRASPYLKDKVQFAHALHAVTAGGSTGTVQARVLPARRRVVISSLAAAAVLAVAVSGYLFLLNQRLHEEGERLRAQPASDAVIAPVPALGTVTFLLPPPRRGADTDGTTVTVAKNTGQVVLRLQVESAEYARFWAALKDVVSGRTIWRSPDIAPEGAGPDRVLTITVPAALLRPQRYGIELSGIGASGSTELLSEYPIRVVLE